MKDLVRCSCCGRLVARRNAEINGVDVLCNDCSVVIDKGKQQEYRRCPECGRWDWLAKGEYCSTRCRNRAFARKYKGKILQV